MKNPYQAMFFDWKVSWSQRIFSQMRIQGKALRARVSGRVPKSGCNSSVTDREVRSSAKMAKKRWNGVIFPEKSQMATPVMARIKVGDSALWLKMTTQIRSEAIISNRKCRSLYFFRRSNGREVAMNPATMTGSLGISKLNHEVSHPIIENPIEEEKSRLSIPAQLW